MLELKESDIRAIAQGRYTAKAGKRFWLILWAVMGLMVVLIFAVPVPYDKSAIAPLIVIGVMMFSHAIGAARFEKAFVADWRRETGQEKPAE